jgi:hypothetical protein
MAINLLILGYPQRFEEFCKDLLAAQFPRFQTFSGQDEGVDGFEPDSSTIFQFYFPEGAPHRAKIKKDLGKARRHPCKFWTLLLPKDPPKKFRDWLINEQQPLYPFKVDVWGRTRIMGLLAKHPNVRDIYFPSGRKPKVKPPSAGDAPHGKEIVVDQCEELREWIIDLVEQEAKRKRRKPVPADYSREFGEFNSNFELSSYSKLPASKFSEARAYLEKKFYSRRRGETKKQERLRLVGGIKTIQKQLRMSDEQYRRHLGKLAGKGSTRDMSPEELTKVFRAFRRMQQEGESEAED